jgi:hypothetical protein
MTYTVEIEAGAFSDSLTTGTLENTVDAASFSFSVHADETGPTVQPSGSPTKDFVGISPASSNVVLAVNEVVQARANDFSIRAWDYVGAAAPDFIGSGEVANGQRQTIVLSFDAVVQSGSDNFEVRTTDTDALLGSAVKVDSSSVMFAGSKVIFQPSTIMADDGLLRESYQ